MADLARRASEAVPRLAAVIDIRSRAFSTDLKSALGDLNARGVRPYVVFLEASDETLVRRFDSVARPHPLQEGGRIVDGIAAERELLQGMRAEADLILDTSALNVHELRSRMRDAFATEADAALRISVVSFGFKYGLPVDADMVADCRFLPNPHWVPELAPQTGRDEPVIDYVLSQPGATDFLDAFVRAVQIALAGYGRIGTALRAAGRRLHRRQAPQRGDGRPDGRPAVVHLARHPGHAPGSRPRVRRARSGRSAPAGRPLRRSVVALGGGHGLHASLSGLRRVTRDLTAIVTVADDGGSSGRLRREFGVLPPGDLRMALAALCGDDAWGTTWSRVIQHRFGNGDSDAMTPDSVEAGLREAGLAGHAVGNVLIVALWELLGDTVLGLDWVARLLGAHGRVLPMSAVPLDLVAEVEGADPDRPDEVTIVRGQVACATTTGRVRSVSLIPADPPACPEAVQAIGAADWVVLGPGSWFTSVLPHLLVPDLAAALVGTRARRLVALNLAPQPGETEGFSPHAHLEVLADHAPDLTIDVVLADRAAARGATAELEKAAGLLGARLVLADLAVDDGSPRHDPRRLAGAFAQIFEGE